MKKILRSDVFFEKNTVEEKIIEKKYKDPFILKAAYFLISIGCMVVISSSYAATNVYNVNKLYFASKHFLFAFLSVILMHFFSKQDERLEKLGFFFWIFSIFSLAAVLIIGHSAKGATRWINILGFNLQPSEFAKIAVMLQGSRYIDKNLNLFILTYAVPLVLIILEPDLGTSLLLLGLMIAQFLTKEVSLKKLAILTSLIFAIIFLSYFAFSHVQERINLFLNPEKDIFGAGYQKFKAFKAIKSGNFFGKGFGKGDIKESLPDAHTDYVFAVIVEEFGIIGGMIIVILFILIGMKVFILRSKNEYLKKVQYSSILLILGQAWLNLASTLSIIPAKGITLPLISYGGSAMITQGVLFGILLSSCSKKTLITKK